MADTGHPSYLWFNGAIVPWEQATLHATATIWTGISAIFEGIRAYWEPNSETMLIFRLRDHLRRLQQSIRLTRLPLPYDPMALLEALPQLLLRNEARENTYIRVVAFPSERRMAGRAEEQVVNLLADTSPYPSVLDDDVQRQLMVSSYTRISEPIMSPQVKAIANYRNSEQAVVEARLAGYDGPVMLNRLGEVSEGAWTNIFIVRNGMLITPDLTSDLLEGITRDTIIRLARSKIRVPAVERRILRTELYLAEEAFLCGTAAEIQCIASVDRHVLGDGGVGPITRRLRAAYANAVYGHNDEHAEWRTAAKEPAPALAES